MLFDSGVTTHLGSLPDVARILGVLLYQRQDACSNDPMGLTEIMVDFCACQSLAILFTVWASGLFTLQRQGDGLLEFLQFLRQRQGTLCH